MISSVRGAILLKKSSSVIVEVGGLGLEVFVPERIIAELGMPGEKISLYTMLNVREDALTLFGFLTDRDRQMFISLLGVSGVGPKVALSVLSAGDSTDLARCIHSEDGDRLVSFPGIGRKTAERIILELKDKIDMSLYDMGGEEEGITADRALFDEAVAALVSIGMTKAGAQRALEDVDTADLGDSFGVEDVVREALKRVSSR